MPGGTAKFITIVTFMKMLEKKINDLMLPVQIVTADSKVISNVNLYPFAIQERSHPLKFFSGVARKFRATRNNILSSTLGNN